MVPRNSGTAVCMNEREVGASRLSSLAWLCPQHPHGIRYCGVFVQAIQRSTPLRQVDRLQINHLQIDHLQIGYLQIDHLHHLQIDHLQIGYLQIDHLHHLQIDHLQIGYLQIDHLQIDISTTDM